MNPAEVISGHVARAVRAYDARSLLSARYRGVGAIHALHACGLLNDTENAEALDRLIDTCADRYTALVASSEPSEGGAQ